MRIRYPQSAAGLRALAGLLAGLTCALPLAGPVRADEREIEPATADVSVAEPAAAAVDAARVESVRHGRTPRGATRIVFETSRPVERLVVERAAGDGVDVTLLDTEPGLAPSEHRVGDDRVDRVRFRLGPTGVVAEIRGTGAGMRVKSFRLPDPPRIVIDCYPPDDAPTPPADDPRTADPAAGNAGGGRPAALRDLVGGTDGSPGGAGPPTVVEPKLVRKPFRTVDTEADQRLVEVTEPIEGERSDRPNRTHEPGTGTTTADAGTTAVAGLFERAEGTAELGTVPADADFDGLLLWIQALRTRVDALHVVESETERAALRRELAFLLAERGLLGEAEKALESSLKSPGADPQTAFPDSLFLGELRLRQMRPDEAATVAVALDPNGRSPAELHRLARLLFDSGRKHLAASLVESAIPGLPGDERARARLLLAHARWDAGNRDGTWKIANDLVKSGTTPPDVLSSALVLAADCRWAAGSFRDAESLYRRAAGLDLTPEEASWTGLQLGHLARRAGRTDEALQRYRTTHESWPDTFYGVQADWFLRVSEQYDRLADAERRGRG